MPFTPSVSVDWTSFGRRSMRFIRYERPMLRQPAESPVHSKSPWVAAGAHSRYLSGFRGRRPGDWGRTNSLVRFQHKG